MQYLHIKGSNAMKLTIQDMAKVFHPQLGYIARNITIQDIAKYFQQYGPWFSSKYFLYAFCKQYKKRHELVNGYLENFYCSMNLNQFQSAPMQRIKEKDYKIWVFWWQDIENMPPIVKLCFDSLRIHAGNIPIYVVTKNNFGEYVSFPPFIMEKFQKGNFSITHFSDILRFALLSQYGGLWLDATIFVSNDLKEYIKTLDVDFFTVKQGKYNKDYFNVSYNRWSNFILGSHLIYNPIFILGLKMFYYFWEKHDVLIDYFFISYVINYLYCRNNFVKKQIEDVPINNSDIFRLSHLLNQPYDKDTFLDITKKTIFHKLSWKTNINCIEENSFYQMMKRFIYRQKF